MRSLVNVSILLGIEFLMTNWIYDSLFAAVSFSITMISIIYSGLLVEESYFIFITYPFSC